MRTKPIAISLSLLLSALTMQHASAEPAQVPIFLMSGNESLVMLNMSNDHELYFKAYDDYSDIDGDGTVDTTYNNNIEYYGYFDSGKCYTYDTGDGRFEPVAEMTTKFYCDDVSGDWSGNFLNWATMTRIDTIRKVLYGGMRSVDTSSATELERQFLPMDAHSFVKYYPNTNSDVQKLTPYSAPISICNTTRASAGNSKDVVADPLMRIAPDSGGMSYAMWTGHEVRQCTWSGEYSSTNNNNSAVTEINAHTTQPALGGDNKQFVVKIEVCNSSLPEDNCKVYPSGNRKPIGLLQEHGEDGSVQFGLMTGSYQKNKSGGVLRKNVSDFRNEVEETTTGQFTATPSGGGIVDTLDRLRLTRYDFGNGQYNALDSCGFGKFGFTDGECSNWGNPQSELYLESLRYFGGLSATSAFSATDTSYINGLGTATWSDPLDNDNYCAPVNIIHFNASTSSFDGDQLGGFGDLPNSPDASSETDKVGVGEGVTDSGTAFVGEITGSTDKSCSPKDLDALSDAKGVCPEAPWLEGTYQIAGLAYYANLNSIRDDLDDVDGDDADIRVKTYGVALSPAQPVIEVPVPGSTTGQQVILLPACMEFRTGPYRHNGNCAIVDFRVVRPHTEVGNVGTGKFMVLWESAQHGGDYDQDMGGVISYSIDGNAGTITVTTQVYGASTGGIHGFGYVISGTTQDGLHIHSGHNNFDDYSDPYGLLDCDDAPGDGDCDSGEPATSITYTLGTTTAKRLETPMYYATKWGGFAEESDANKRPPSTAAPNNVPDQDYEWDEDGDDLPDNYFFARNPGQLSAQLATVFQTIDTVSSSASVVANSVSLQTTTRIYQARFDSADWSGKLLSFPVDLASGNLEEEEWDAGTVIAAQNLTGSSWNPTGRNFVTWDGSAGVAFTWDDNGTRTDLTDDTTPLSTAQRTFLNLNPDGVTIDGLGEERLKYIRGDFTNELSEGSSVAAFRNRSTPLGDVVHSTPTIVAAPNFGYRDTIPGTTTNFESAPYSGFKTKYAASECFLADGTTAITSWSAGSGGSPGSREPMVYFGANDGALHAISACSGQERLAYVPQTVFPNLSKLTDTGYSHQYYVDGAPTVVDAFWSSAWHTALLGTLGAGGKGVFALDVTDPGTFSEGNASSIVLWEINPTTDIDGDGSADYPNLGYTFSQPAIIKAEGFGWVAVFGNGYDSASGSAILYFANIEDGTLLGSIDMEDVNSTANDIGYNGMSTVSPIDTDGDGDVDLIYAGDLKGNVWRVGSTSSGFFSGTTSLLYSAKNASGDAQPITTRFAVGRHPTSAVGRIVYFGTGKYYELDDQDPSNAVTYNSMYGLWDRDTGATIGSVTARDNTATLQKQTITLEQAGTFGSNAFDVRVLSANPLTWVTYNPSTSAWNSCSSSAHCGWYLDLESTGEKMVANPILRGGRLIFVTTIPSLVPCAAGGTGWLMEIDPNTGGRLDTAVFDLNGDGVFNYNDNLNTGSSGSPVYLPVSGKKSKVGILQPPAILSGIGGSGDGSYGGKEGKYSSGSRDAQIDVTIENPGILGAGRKSWVRIK